MSYLLSFSEKPEEIWTLANRYTDWFIEELTGDLTDKRLKAFIIETTYYQGFDFRHCTDKQKELTGKFLKLLQKKLPDIIDKSMEHENRALKNHLKNLHELVNDQNIFS